MELPAERTGGRITWARGRRWCPSSCGPSRPRRRCSDGQHVRLRGVPGRELQGGVRGGDGGAAGRRPDRRRTAGSLLRAGIAAKAEALGRYGARLVTVVEHAGLARYNPEAVATASAGIRAGGHRAAPASAEGHGPGPRTWPRRPTQPSASDINFPLAVRGRCLPRHARRVHRQGGAHAPRDREVALVGPAGAVTAVETPRQPRGWRPRRRRDPAAPRAWWSPRSAPGSRGRWATGRGACGRLRRPRPQGGGELRLVEELRQQPSATPQWGPRARSPSDGWRQTRRPDRPDRPLVTPTSTWRWESAAPSSTSPGCAG